MTNACGLLSKVGEFQHVMKQHNPDIAILTETKLTEDKCTSAQISIPGYSSPLRRDRTAHGGGVAVWVKNSLAFQELDIDSQHYEVIWLSVSLHSGKKVLVCALYRSGSLPGDDVQTLEYIDSMLGRLRTPDC